MSDQHNQAQFFVDMFGSQAELARAIGVDRQRVRYWVETTLHVPYKYHAAVFEAAKERGWPIHPLDFVRHLIAAD